MNSDTYAAMSDRLRSLTRNQMFSARTGSTPVRHAAGFSLTCHELYLLNYYSFVVFEISTLSKQVSNGRHTGAYNEQRV